MAKAKADAKKYVIEIQQKSVKIIVFILFLINAVFFLIGYFVGKAANIKKINDSIIAAVPAELKDKNKAAEIKKEQQPVVQETQKQETPVATQQPQAQPVKPVQTAAAPKSSNTKTYTLEIYSYKTQREAEQFRDILKVRGTAAYIHKTSNSRYGTLYKVRIGKFNSRQAANNEGKRLESQGIIPNFYIQEY